MPPPGSLPLLQVIELQPQGGRLLTLGNRKVKYDSDTNEDGIVRGLCGLSPKVKGLILLNLVSSSLTLTVYIHI